MIFASPNKDLAKVLKHAEAVRKSLLALSKAVHELTPERKERLITKLIDEKAEQATNLYLPMITFQRWTSALRKMMGLGGR